MSVWALLLVGLVAMILVMAALYVVQRRTHNAGIVDIGWSFGIGALAILFALASDGYLPRRVLVAGLLALWSFRLGFHLVRRVGSEVEDGRYRELRDQMGDRLQTFLFWFFQFQALLVLLFVIPALVVMQRPVERLTAWDGLGFGIWLVAVVGEAIADRQLARFRRDPANRGKVCRVGLWRYSRHPNYFFEWVHWWAYCAMAVGAPYGWITLLGPAAMLLFLFKVTGIPPTERQALRSRGEAYREYQHTTSVFFPWPPKERSA